MPSYAFFITVLSGSTFLLVADQEIHPHCLASTHRVGWIKTLRGEATPTPLGSTPLEIHGPEAVKTGDKCLTKQTERGARLG
jgi:hypothetical protein